MRIRVLGERFGDGHNRVLPGHGRLAVGTRVLKSQDEGLDQSADGFTASPHLIHSNMGIRPIMNGWRRSIRTGTYNTASMLVSAWIE